MRFGVGALSADVRRHLLPDPLLRERGAEGQDAQLIFDNGLRRQLQELRPLMGSEQMQSLRRVMHWHTKPVFVSSTNSSLERS